MQQPISHERMKSLVGKSVFAIRRDGSRVEGTLVGIQNGQLMLQSKPVAKKMSVSNIVMPLVLYDLLVIGLLNSGYPPYPLYYSPYPYQNPYGYRNFYGR